MDPKEVNKTKAKDVLYALTKGAVGMTPLVGSTAAELFSLIIAPPIEKRRNEWMEQVGEQLSALLSEKRLTIDDIQHNEHFHNVVIQATTYALRTNEAIKIKALQNAIINTATGQTPDEAITHIYLGLVDRFTGWHIKLLTLFQDPRVYLSQHKIHLNVVISGSLSRVVTAAFPELKERDDLVQLVWNELRDAGFHTSGDIHTMMTADGLMDKRTSKLADDFLAFIEKRDAGS